MQPQVEALRAFEIAVFPYKNEILRAAKNNLICRHTGS
jgi:hypothetical protein